MRTVCITNCKALIDMDIISKIKSQIMIFAIILNIDHDVAIIITATDTAATRTTSLPSAREVNIIARQNRCCWLIATCTNIPGLKSVGQIGNVGIITKDTLEIIIPAKLTVLEADAFTKEITQGITHCLQLAAVDSVHAVSIDISSGNVSDFLTASINTTKCNAWTTCDGQAIAVNRSTTHGDTTITT